MAWSHHVGGARWTSSEIFVSEPVHLWVELRGPRSLRALRVLCLAEPCHRMAEHSGAAKKQEMACSARCPTAAQNGYNYKVICFTFPYTIQLISIHRTLNQHKMAVA